MEPDPAIQSDYAEHGTQLCSGTTVSLSQDVMRTEVSSITGEVKGLRAGNPVKVRDCNGVSLHEPNQPLC